MFLPGWWRGVAPWCWHRGAGGVVLVVKGKENAEVRVKHFETGQSSEDRHAGWRYFVEKSDLKAGMDPAEATNLRQMKLEIRESQAQPDQNAARNPLVSSSPCPRVITPSMSNRHTSHALMMRQAKNKPNPGVASQCRTNTR